MNLGGPNETEHDYAGRGHYRGVFAAAACTEVEWNAANVLGGAIAAAAFPPFVVARIQLGGAFSYKPKAQKLVTTGLYARIRNPIYFFGGLVVLGLSLFLS
ncbi:MAG TPA: methyltransferase, partial [Acidobacteriaceae bacterium]|nr:methyltransferase [Acidobacteriaceae bacterium]